MSSSLSYQPSSKPSVEFWSTEQIHSALHHGDITIWRKIVMALKRDPYGRTAHQVEEVLDQTSPVGITKILREVLTHSRNHLQASECAEVARHIQALIDHSKLTQQEFGSRIGVQAHELADYLTGAVSPPASLMIRMRRVADRFSRLAAAST